MEEDGTRVAIDRVGVCSWRLNCGGEDGAAASIRDRRAEGERAREEREADAADRAVTPIIYGHGGCNSARSGGRRSMFMLSLVCMQSRQYVCVSVSN